MSSFSLSDVLDRNQIQSIGQVGLVQVLQVKSPAISHFQMDQQKIHVMSSTYHKPQNASLQPVTTSATGTKRLLDSKREGRDNTQH